MRAISAEGGMHVIQTRSKRSKLAFASKGLTVDVSRASQRTPIHTDTAAFPRSVRRTGRTSAWGDKQLRAI